MSSNAKKVTPINLEKTVTPVAWRISAPAPNECTSRQTPLMKAIDVLKIGRNLRRHASSCCRRDRPVLVLRREHTEDEQHAEWKDVQPVLPERICWVGQIGPLEADALGQLFSTSTHTWVTFTARLRLLCSATVASSKRTGDSYAERARVFKALADPHRLHIIDVLSVEGTLCGTDLAERVGISLALLSHHWKVLTEVGLISREQRGQTRYCAIECKRLQEVMVPWPVPPPESSVKPSVRKTTAKTALPAAGVKTERRRAPRPEAR